ncbi:MAG: hypothetical protein V1689_10160 [Pseudomonadota bacterium]
MKIHFGGASACGEVNDQKIYGLKKNGIKELIEGPLSGVLQTNTVGIRMRGFEA